MVEAVASLFVPLCIYNNTKDDRDAKALAAYGERAWNNPVVRVVDGNRRDVTVGLTRQWSVAGMSDLMVRALQAKKRDVPKWLSLLATTSAANKEHVESAIFGMS